MELTDHLAETVITTGAYKDAMEEKLMGAW
jgi:hypothetical protein